MGASAFPTEAQLRAAVDRCLLGASPSPESEALLRQYSTAALRHILDRRDRRLLACALRAGLFSPELAGRLERETPNLPYPLRLLLQHPELADAVPPPEPSAEKTAVASGYAEERLERW